MVHAETPLHADLNAAQSETSKNVANPLPAVEVERGEQDDFPFEDPVKEARFQAAWRILKSTPDPRAKPNWTVFFVVLLIAGLLLFPAGQLDFTNVGILAGALLLHELGHLLAMKFFGYTDGKLFFIPFFTLAVIGKKHAAPAWQQALVILSGPFPGLAIALLWYALVREDAAPWELRAVLLLLAVNLIQLLPFEPFDGGKFLNLILFSRNAWIETFMKVVTGVSLGVLAWMHMSPILGLIAVFTLISVPYHFRKGLMIARLRREGLSMPETVKELTPLQGRMLFAAAYDVLKNQHVGDSVMAAIMRDLHDRVLVPAPRLAPTLGFLLLYTGTIGLGVGTLALIAIDIVQLSQQEMRQEFERARLKQEVNRESSRVKRRIGPAREQAVKRVKELQAQLREQEESMARTSEKLAKFHAMLPLPGGGGDPFDFKEFRERDQEREE